METCSKVSGGSEPLKKAKGWPFGSLDTKTFQIFPHARHRETNTTLGLRSSNTIMMMMMIMMIKTSVLKLLPSLIAVQGAPSSCSNLISFNATKLSVSLQEK